VATVYALLGYGEQPELLILLLPFFVLRLTSGGMATSRKPQLDGGNKCTKILFYIFNCVNNVVTDAGTLPDGLLH